MPTSWSDQEEKKSSKYNSSTTNTPEGNVKPSDLVCISHYAHTTHTQ